jgi:uncharacterized membrane protein required for colicin V production
LSLADIVLIIYLLLAVFIGFRSGIIKVAGGIGAFICAYWIAREFSALFAEQVSRSIPALSPGSGQEFIKILSLFIDTDAIANRLVQLISFAIIFIVAAYIIRLIAGFLDSVLRGTILGKLNSVLGAALGFVAAVLLFNLLFAIVLPVLDTNEYAVKLSEFLLKAKIMLPLMGDFKEFISSSVNMV